MSTLTAAQAERTMQKRPFILFLFLKVDLSWRLLHQDVQAKGMKEFETSILEAQREIEIRTYLTYGLRADTDLMLWMIGSDAETIQSRIVKLLKTGFGKHLSISQSYPAMKRESVYTSKHVTAFDLGLKPLKYLIVYPFVKSREWYLLPFEERKRIMEEHADVGKKFPKVRLNTTYSFGVGDQDFMLAFETDDLAEFQDLIMQLRESEASKYTVRDTPMIVCVTKSLQEIIKAFL